MTDLLSESAIDAGWSDLEEAASYTHFRPLADAATRFVTEAQSDRRITLGIGPFDHEMRGISPGHLAMLVGYTHSGKTLLALHVMRHNHDKRIALFIPDEPAPLVLTKLASLTFGITARELEARVADEDPNALRMLHETVEEYPNLVIFDKPLNPRTMRNGFEEATDHWGENADLVIVDYLDLLQGRDLAARADCVKAFGSDNDVPMVVLHQPSRSAGAQGRKMRIDSGGYGGETWATFQIGVWRKKNAIEAEFEELDARREKSNAVLERMDELQREARIHEYTLTANLNKNKRPGGRLVDGLDFEVDLESGALRLLHGDLPRQFQQTRHLRVAGSSYNPYDELEGRW
jgi:hypothetical protein